MRRLAAVVALATLAGGWIAYVHLWRHGDSRRLPYRDATGELHGFQPPRATTRVIPHWRGIDETAVLVASGPRSSTGYRLQVVSAIEERARIVLTLHEESPTVANPGRAQVTYPYRLLLFEPLGKPVHVHVEGRP